MTTTVQERLEAESFFDAAIVRHGFVDYMRDYEILVAGRGAHPRDDWHRYHFTGCVEAHCCTTLSPEVLAGSLGDEFVFSGPDYPERPEPDGFIWGVRWSCAYPGLKYIEGGARSAAWSQCLGTPLHEVTVETNAFHLRLVFADFRYEFLGRESEIQPRPKDYPISG